MGKHGIPVEDLRPFSVEDPFGVGIGGPTAADLQRERVRAGLSAAEAKRLERSDDRRQRQRQQNVPIPGASLVQGYRALESTAPPKQQREERRPRTPPRGPVAPPGAQAKPKKGKGLGCLTTILLIWGVVAGGQFLLGPVLREAEQFVLREVGSPQAAQVLLVTPTEDEFNDRRVYEIALSVRQGSNDTESIELRQALGAEVAARLEEGGWVEIKTFDGDVDHAVITRVGLPPPDQQESPTAQPGPLDPPDADDGGAAPAPDGAPSEVGTENPAPAPDSAPVEAEATPSDDSVEGVALECLQARACCRLLQPNNSGCDAFSNPNIEGEVCARSMRTFKQAAAAMGKNCDGL